MCLPAVNLLGECWWTFGFGLYVIWLSLTQKFILQTDVNVSTSVSLSPNERNVWIWMDQWLKQMNFGVYFLTNTCDFCDPVFAVTFYIYIYSIFILWYVFLTLTLELHNFKVKKVYIFNIFHLQKEFNGLHKVKNKLNLHSLKIKLFLFYFTNCQNCLCSTVLNSLISLKHFNVIFEPHLYVIYKWIHYLLKVCSQIIIFFCYRRFLFQINVLLNFIFIKES